MHIFLLYGLLLEEPGWRTLSPTTWGLEAKTSKSAKRSEIDLEKNIPASAFLSVFHKRCLPADSLPSPVLGTEDTVMETAGLCFQSSHILEDIGKLGTQILFPDTSH
ncbi:uncharacterized protein AAG666_001536 isoform 1-T1 [Megaptera novaeangliae]